MHPNRSTGTRQIEWMQYLFKLLADHGEGFVDGVDVAGDGHDPLRARAVRDVDLGCTLKPFPAFPECPEMQSFEFRLPSSEFL